MKQDAAVIGYLGRALSLELSAVQQYLSLSRLLDMRGVPDAGKCFQREAQEELEHAERIIARMLALGFAPNATQLQPTRLNGSLLELMAQIVTLEGEIIEFYSQASRHCLQIRDYENRIFFETLLQEEQEHVKVVTTWQQRLLDGQTEIFN